MTFHECCTKVLVWCNNGYAKTYAEAGLAMTDPYEIKVQAMYIVGNIAGWRGDMAKAVRTELKLIGGMK